MQSTYILVLRTLLRDQRPFLLLLLLLHILILLFSLTSWNLNAPKTQHAVWWGERVLKGRKVSECPSVATTNLRVQTLKSINWCKSDQENMKQTQIRESLEEQQKEGISWQHRNKTVACQCNEATVSVFTCSWQSWGGNSYFGFGRLLISVVFSFWVAVWILLTKRFWGHRL